MNRDRYVLAGILVGDLVEDIREALAGPGVPVVVVRMAFVVVGRGAPLSATLLEGPDGPEPMFAGVLPDVAAGPEDRIPHDDRGAIHGDRLQPELPDEFLQRIGAGSRI